MIDLKKALHKWFHPEDQTPPMPEPNTDWVGYEVLIEFIEQNNLLSVPGDLLEIGAFLGGGTRKLSQLLSRSAPDKRLWVIDVFDPTFDWTKNTQGDAMASLYAGALARFNGKSQWEIFQENTKDCANINVVKSDSRKAQIGDARLCFAFIDGNHSPEYVRSDFLLAWSHLNSLGGIVFDDYGKDLPQTTMAIDELVEKFRPEIASFSVNAERHMAYIIRK